jgi:hypothetical protein
MYTAPFMAIEYGLEVFLTPLFEKICREQVDPEIRKTRSIKGVKNIYKGFYNLGVSIFAYIVLRETYIVPPLLGGNDSFYEHFNTFPYWEHPKYYSEFYLTCMGYNVSSLLMELFYEPKNKSDYLETVLHHLVTVFLIVFSYVTNMYIGAPILFVHNSSDTLNCFSRVMNETKYFAKAYLIFFPSILIWVYMRCLTFP